jgi:sialate O-acetylesterase
MEVKTGKDGKWQMYIQTPKADLQPHCIQFNDGEKSALTNILFGEVWLCSGQSNMEMTFKGFDNEFVADADSVLDDLNKNIPLRLFKLKRNSQDSPGTEVDGTWTTCTRDQVERFSAVGYFFGEHLCKELNVPVGIILSAWGGSCVEGWMSEELVKKHSEELFNTDFADSETWKKPEVMYNGMIHPLKDFCINGVCWYQGEANVNKPETYQAKLSDMISLWRSIWKNDSLPFLLVEIAPFAYENGDQAADLRMAQRKVVESVPYCRFVSTADLVLNEEEKNIHPSNKLDVGKRLAQQAAFMVYHINHTCVNYPKIARITRTSHELTILIQTDSELRTTDGSQTITGMVAKNTAGELLPLTFELGIDRKSIIGKGSHLEQVATISYAYGGFVLGNIQNTCGLPLVVFKEQIQ